MLLRNHSYATFLEDLCTKRRNLHVAKKAFRTQQTSDLFQCKTLLKFKDLGSLLSDVPSGNQLFDKALLDLGVVLISYHIPFISNLGLANYI